MNIYTIQAECDAQLSEIDRVIESTLINDEHIYESALEESLANSVSAISEEYSSKAATIYKNFNVAFRKKDYNTAIKHLNELENLVRQWDSKLKSLPPEKIGRTIIKNTIRIIGIIAGLAIMIGGPILLAKILPTSVIKLIGRGILPKTVSSSRGLSAAAFVGGTAISMGGSQAYMKSITSLMTEMANKKLYKSKHTGENDHNAHNGRYVAEVLVIDQWLKTIARMKKKVQDIQTGN